MIISFIAAIGKNRELGVANKLPWHLPDDLKHFRDITRGHPVIIGRKTYESIGRLLPDRKNIIVTRDASYRAPDATIVTSIEEAIKAGGDDPEIFVIGGGEMFKLAFPYANRMYLTIVDDSPKADAYFPEFDPSEWNIVSEKFHDKDDKHAYSFTFKQYERN